MLAHPPGYAPETTARTPAGRDSGQAGQASGHVAPADTAAESAGAEENGTSPREGQNGRSPHAATAGTELDGLGRQQHGPGGSHSRTGDLLDTDHQGTAAAREADGARQGTGPPEAEGPGDSAELAEAPGPHGLRDASPESGDAEALRQRISELEAANTQLETESAAKDAVIAEQHDAIEAKDAAIAEQDAALADKDGLIASQWRVISELDHRIDDLAAGDADPGTEGAGLAADKANPAVDGADVAADSTAPGTGADRPDQGLVRDNPDTGDEEQAGLAGIDSRTADLPEQENEQPTAARRWLRLVPSNETAVVLTGVAAMSTTIANVTHQLGDGWYAVVGAAVPLAVGGVAWVNKYWKKGSNGSQSQD
jgi:hypothetical protein